MELNILVLENKTHLKEINKLVNYSRKNKEIVAILIKKDTLRINKSKTKIKKVSIVNF